MRPSRFLTVSEIADLYQVSTRTVRRWISSKKLAAHRIGSILRVSTKSMNDFERIYLDPRSK